MLPPKSLPHDEPSEIIHQPCITSESVGSSAVWTNVDPGLIAMYVSIWGVSPSKSDKPILKPGHPPGNCKSGVNIVIHPLATASGDLPAANPLGLAPGGARATPRIWPFG